LLAGTPSLINEYVTPEFSLHASPQHQQQSTTTAATPQPAEVSEVSTAKEAKIPPPAFPAQSSPPPAPTSAIAPAIATAQALHASDIHIASSADCISGSSNSSNSSNSSSREAQTEPSGSIPNPSNSRLLNFYIHLCIQMAVMPLYCKFAILQPSPSCH
jgi:hypothetical protein